MRLAARTIAIVAPLFAAQMAIAASAAPGLTPPGYATRIDKAVSIYLTKKGEQSLSQNLESILGNSGISLRSAFFSELAFKSEKPVELAQLAEKSPEGAKMLADVRTLLSEWFMNLAINDPQPNVMVKNAGFQVSFKSLAIVVDRAAHARLKAQSGAVIALEAEIDRILIGSEELLITDPKNEMVGTVGVFSPMLSLAPGSKNLKLRVPLFLDVNSKGNIDFRVLGFESNFAETSMALGYNGLLLPDISIVINGRSFPMNKQKLVDTFERMKPKLVDNLRTMLDKIAADNFQTSAVGTLKEKMPKEFSQISRLRPPGAPNGQAVEDFVWGMSVRKINMNETVLAMELDSFVEDPVNGPLAIPSDAGSRGPVSLAGSDPRRYDLAIAINRGLMNRILNQSYRRGFFREVEKAPGEMLKVRGAPRLDVYKPTANKDENFARLVIRAQLQSPVKGLIRDIMIKKDVHFDVDVIARFTQVRGEKGLRMQLEDIDLSTLWVDPNSMSGIGRLFRKSVVSGVKKELTDAAKEWKKKPNIMEGELPLPPQLFGQTLQVRQMRMDRNGYVVMFLDFAPPEARLVP